MSAQPQMMLTAASSYKSAAYTVNSVAKATQGVAGQLVGEWKGKGAEAFMNQMNDLKGYSPLAAESLIGVAVTLQSLASQITAAQNLAKQALALAESTTKASNSLDQAYTNMVQQNVANLKPNATPAQTLAASQPTAAQSAEAATLANDASSAISMMNQANTMARQAWAAATAAFDAVTALSPAMQEAAVAANVKQFSSESMNMELLMLINAYGSMEVDYGDPEGDEDDTPEADIPTSEMSDGALAAEIADLEHTKVDGENVDGQLAADAEGGIGVGNTDNVSIEQGYLQFLLSENPDTQALVQGANPFGDKTASEYQSANWDPNANGGKGGWIYPPNHGAEPGTTVVHQGANMLQPGTEISRFGGPGGTYASPVDTPWAERALPADTLAKGPSNYHVYEVTNKWATNPPPLTVVQSKVAPAFDQPGGGTQYEFVGPAGAPSNAPKINVSWLVKNGYLKEVTPSS